MERGGRRGKVINWGRGEQVEERLQNGKIVRKGAKPVSRVCMLQKPV